MDNIMALKDATRHGGAVEALRPAKTQYKSYHFVGIGGCGMSALAEVLVHKGHKVSGTDMQPSEVLYRLTEQGIRVRVNHSVEAIPDKVDCVVISAAVKETNPELQWARQHGVKVMKYAELLGELSGQFKTLAIAGTHGKSTTSGWVAYLLDRAGRSPNFVVGADVRQLGGGSGTGSGGHLVVEACEFDRSFLSLQPTVAAILNIEADHLDYYKDIDDIVDAFGEFASRVGEKGWLIVNSDDPRTPQAIKGRNLRVKTFGLRNPSDWRADNLHYESGHGCFDLVHQGEWIGRVKLSLAGEHNVANALAAAALARKAGLKDEEILAGLASFEGVGRRMMFKAQVRGATVVDDYGHHPTEIRTTLAAIRAKYQPRKLWCIFQPHQHSRTRFFLDDFALSFAAADVVLFPDIYFVRDSETLRREVNAEQLADKVCQQGGQAIYLGEFARIVEHLGREVQPGDVVVTMGAGDIWKVADEFIRRFK